MFRFFFQKIRLISWILLALLLFLLFLLSTESGLYVVFYSVKKVVPGNLSYKALHGYLLGNFSIEKLHYQQDSSLKISAEKLHLRWNPQALIYRQLAIQSLNIQEIKATNIDIQEINVSGIIDLTTDLPISLSMDALLRTADKKSYPLKVNVQTKLQTLQAKIIVGDEKLKLGEFTLKGQYDSKLNLDWALKAPDLMFFASFPGSLAAQGKIQGLTTDANFTAQIEGHGIKLQKIYLKNILSNVNVQHIQTKKMSIDWNTQLKPGDLMYDNGAQKSIIPFQKAGFNVQWHKNILQIKTGWIFDAAKRFEGYCTITPLDFQALDFQHLERQHLSGELIFAMNNLDFMNTPESPLKKIKGSLEAKFKLAGNLAKPLWHGDGYLKASAELPDLGLTLNHIDLNVKSDAKNIQLHGQIISGQNALLITGESMAPFNKEFKAKLTGKNFPFMNSKEYKIHITPDLQIQWVSNELMEDKIIINGTIDIPLASIQPLEFSQSLELPSDVEFVSDKKKETSRLKIESRVNVRLGDDVKINTHGLSGRLAGSVLVIDKNNEPTGEGSIQIIGGVYDAYGQKLEITKGQISFTGGSIDNPQLLVRATRTFSTNTKLSPISNSPIPTTTADMAPTSQMPTQFDNITVGVEVSGYLNSTVIRLFSVPATLSQADILSFLVLGRPMTQASSADGALLMRALSAMNIGSTESSQITQQLQKTFGLDVFNVETHSQYDPSQNMVTSSTSLVIGKMLSPKLFVDYSIGLLQGTNVLKVKYFLTPRWIFQTETNGANEGVDILYSFSRP